MVVVHAAAGIMRAFADLPYPAALAASAGIAATGVAQLAAISSASSGGGGSIGRGGGGRGLGPGAGRDAVGQVDAPLDTGGGGGGRSRVEITLAGDNFTKDQVRGLIDQINEEIQDGAELVA